MIKVGNVKEYIEKEDKKSGKMKRLEVLYSYKDVHYDNDGWADCREALPEDYDLVYMKVDRKNHIPGWNAGASWYGLRLKSGDSVTHWKRKPEEKE